MRRVASFGMDLFLLTSGIGSRNCELEAGVEIATVGTNVVGFTRMLRIGLKKTTPQCETLRGGFASLWMQACGQGAVSSCLRRCDKKESGHGWP